MQHESSTRNDGVIMPWRPVEVQAAKAGVATHKHVDRTESWTHGFEVQIHQREIDLEDLTPLLDQALYAKRGTG